MISHTCIKTGDTSISPKLKRELVGRRDGGSGCEMGNWESITDDHGPRRVRERRIPKCGLPSPKTLIVYLQSTCFHLTFFTAPIVISFYNFIFLHLGSYCSDLK